MSSMDVTTVSLRFFAPKPAKAAPAKAPRHLHTSDQELAELRQLMRKTRRFDAWASKLSWVGSAAAGFLIALPI